MVEVMYDRLFGSRLMPFARIDLRYGNVLFHVFFLLFVVLMWFISNRKEIYWLSFMLCMRFISGLMPVV